MKNKATLIFITLIFFLLPLFLAGKEPLYLKNNLAKTSKGDFIVTQRGKNYTLLHIHDIDGQRLRIEEITVPVKRFPKGKIQWRDWVAQKAPWNTSWLIYEIQIDTGRVIRMFSVHQNCWCQLRQQDSFLTTLINLRLSHVSAKNRKKIGPPLAGKQNDSRRLWMPRMIVDGKIIQGVSFDAWKTRWPSDGSELAEKTIEVYVPEENDKYPAYFPYWLEVSGMVGKAKVHIVNSGTNLESPAGFPEN